MTAATPGQADEPLALATEALDLAEHGGVDLVYADRMERLKELRRRLAALAAPPSPGRQAAQLDAALHGLAQIREHVEDEHRDWPDVELAVNDVIAEINELAAVAAQDTRPAPGDAERLAIAMAALRKIDQDGDNYSARATAEEALSDIADLSPRLHPELRPAPELAAHREFTGEILGELRQALGADPDSDAEPGEAPEAHAIRLVHYLKERIDELHGLIAEGEPLSVKPSDDVKPAPELAEIAAKLAEVAAERDRLLAAPGQREMDSLREKVEAAEQDAAEVRACAVHAFAIIAVLARDNPAAQRQANDLRKQIGMLPSPPEADIAEPKPAPELAAAMAETREVVTSIAADLDKLAGELPVMFRRNVQELAARWRKRIGLPS